MTNRSKAKGTSWESAIRDYLQANGWPHAERMPLSGNKDRGDILLPGVCIEAKSTRRHELAEWINELEAEQANAGATVGAVWVKRVAKTSPGAGYVVMTGATFVELLKGAGY